jgi:O-antigen/teichoic acid export membrane protein
MEKNSSFKNFSYISIGRIVGVALQASFYLLFAFLLEPESYGQLNYIIALAGTFALVSRFGINYTITVYRAKQKSDLSDQLNTLFLVTTSAGALILLSIDLYAALLSLALSFFSMNQHNLLGLKKYKKFMLNTFLKNVLIVTIPVLLFFVLEIPGILLGMVISNLLGSIPLFKMFNIKSFFELKNHIRVLIHNFGVEASIALPRMVDKLLIAPLFGFFIVGIYQFNMQILFAIELLPTALYFFLLSEESSGVIHRKLTYFVILGSVLISSITIILAPVFVNEFFPKYSEGVFSLQILVLSIIPLSISSVFTAKLQAQESTRIGLSAPVRIFTLLAFIALLGEYYGLVGLSIAVLLSIIINTVFLYFLYYRSKH